MPPLSLMTLYVRSSPESGHFVWRSARLLSANSGAYWSVRRFGLLRHQHRECDEESRTFANLGLDPNSAAVHLDDPFRYRKPEPGTFFLAGLGIVGLLKLLKFLS